MAIGQDVVVETDDWLLATGFRGGGSKRRNPTSDKQGGSGGGGAVFRLAKRVRGVESES